MKRYLERTLLLMGSIFILSAIIMKWQTIANEEKLIEEYKNRMETLNDEQDKMQESEADTDNTEVNKTEKEHENIIGIIEIPKIELIAPIGEGTDNQTLKYSVGHFENTAMPGEKGNCCIIGHRSYTYGEYFNRLDEIEKNDDITIQYDNNIYDYGVRDIFVVDPDEISVLENNEENDPEITLITCTPLRIGSHRLIIKGILK